MNKVLVINGSVTAKENSVSQELGKRFVEEYKKHNKEDEIIELDLNALEVGTNVLSVNNFSTYWSETEGMKYINQLKEVDKIIVIAPMYNFNVSGLLKNYIDHVALANQTFSYKYSKKGDAIGLLDHLKVQILSTQGAPKGWYPWGDHVAYLEGTWKFMGGKVAEPILLAGVKLDPLMSMKPQGMIDTIQDEISKKAAKF